jgi:N-acyl-D-amino-acid deacylase
VIAPGYKADFNIIDFENLSLRRPVMAFDLPGGARRLIQKSTGYDATIVSGEVVMENGEATQARPGQLLRGARPTPA